jgi:hypothetical protein
MYIYSYIYIQIYIYIYTSMLLFISSISKLTGTFTSTLFSLYDLYRICFILVMNGIEGTFSYIHIYIYIVAYVKICKNCPSARCASAANVVCRDDHVFGSRNILLRHILQDSCLYIIVLLLHVYFSHFHLYVSNIIIIIIIIALWLLTRHINNKELN